MYDRQVRRRRAVLAGLVALSLVLLTVAFGESTGGVRSVQRGALQVLGPIQDGASRVLKPFRDLFNWVGDTVDAKEQRDKLVKERDALQKQVAELEPMRRENADLKRMLDINESSLDRFQPIPARSMIFVFFAAVLRCLANFSGLRPLPFESCLSTVELMARLLQNQAARNR